MSRTEFAGVRNDISPLSGLLFINYTIFYKYAAAMWLRRLRSGDLSYASIRSPLASIRSPLRYEHSATVTTNTRQPSLRTPGNRRYEYPATVVTQQIE
jgi:hypothetical protein